MIIELLKCIADFCLNKYFVFYFGIIIFFMPVFYRLRLFIETKKNHKLCSKAMHKLCNKEPFWEPDEMPELCLINDSIKSFSYINIVSQALFKIDLFENNEPLYNVGFKECSIIKNNSLNHYISLYNKSLFSGFWSLVLMPVFIHDDINFKIHLFKNENNESERMIIIIKYDSNYISYFKFTNIKN